MVSKGARITKEAKVVQDVKRVPTAAKSPGVVNALTDTEAGMPQVHPVKRKAGEVKRDVKGAFHPASRAENIALYPKVKEQLMQQNLAQIANRDSRLAVAVKGSGTKNPNFSIGSGTASEADSLGRIWVGDGAKRTADGRGWISADGTRVYRAPSFKSSAYATTGVQANFEIYSINPVTGRKKQLSNGHLNIKQ